jgi:hypothetical protein
MKDINMLGHKKKGPVELSGYMQLHDKEIMLIASNVTVMPTNYLAKEAKYASKHHKVLFIYEEPTSEYLNMQIYLDNENINILYVANLTIEDMEHYIIDNKPEYIYIDYFTSINTRQDFTNDNDKIIYLLDKLREYTEKYDIKFMIVDRYNTKTDPKSIYLTDTYNNVNCVWILKVDTMTRIK